MNNICENFENYCNEENYDKIKEYLTHHSFLANYNNGEYFEIIADKGNLSLIKLFVDNGARIDIDNNYVLYICAYGEKYDCVNYLLNNGANIENIKNSCGYNNAIRYLNTIK